MLLNRDDGYDTSRDLDWTFSYADRSEAFPASWSDATGVPTEAWEKYVYNYRWAAEYANQTAIAVAAAG